MTTLSAPVFEISVLSEHHLQALVSLSATAAAAHDFQEVLDLAADGARAALGVDQLSVSRWELAEDRLRTLIVSQEGLPEERRHPTDETYPLADYPRSQELLSRGRAHVNAIDDPDADPAEVGLLIGFGMESSAAVPIVYEGRAWGEMYVCTGPGRPRVSPTDVAFLQAVAAQLAVALGRAEHFSRVSRAAYEDQLTGLANRRAFEDGLAAAVESAERDGRPLTLVLGDLDGLKLLNDSAGHAAGDAALRAVGAALAQATPPGAIAARVGGDEFCALLPGARAPRGEAVAAAVADQLAALDPPLRVAWGVACLGGVVQNARDLLRAADEAQYEAKRRGRSSRTTSRLVTVPEPEIADLLTLGLDALDTMTAATRLQRARRVAGELADGLGSPRWTILHRPHDAEEIETLIVCDHRLAGAATVSFDDRRRPTAAFPVLARLMAKPGTEMVTREAALRDAPAERMLLDALGLVAVAGASVTTATGIDGLLVYADETTRPLATAAPVMRALLAAI